MAVAHDNAALLAAISTATTQTTGYTPTGTPRGILVLIVQDSVTSDQISGVTYGGVAMVELPSSPVIGIAGEPGVVYAYHLGAAIPTGTQNVAITSTGTAVKLGVVISMTAARDTEYDAHTILNTSSTVFRRDQVTPTARAGSCMIYRGAHDAFTDVYTNVFTGNTHLFNFDYGSRVAQWCRRTSADIGNGSTAFDVGYVDAGVADDQHSYSVAIREIPKFEPFIRRPHSGLVMQSRRGY